MGVPGLRVGLVSKWDLKDILMTVKAPWSQLAPFCWLNISFSSVDTMLLIKLLDEWFTYEQRELWKERLAHEKLAAITTEIFINKKREIA